MKNSMFGVFHVYDVDGGFGDAIGSKDLICVCVSKEEAEEVARTFSNPHVYDVPYAELKCGDLVVEELPTTVRRDQMWWLKKSDEDEDEPEQEVAPEEMDDEYSKLPKFASFARYA